MGEVAGLTDRQIETMIGHYRAAGRTEGGKYSLADLLLEQRRRKPTDFPPRDVARVIIEKSRASQDGLVTYVEIWNAFLQGRPWQANNSRRIVRDALYRVVAWCVEHRLPIITVLVVRKQERRLSAEAIVQIYEECRDLGLDVGLHPDSFVQGELEKSRQLTVDALPPPDRDGEAG